jgi:hypothetical protein
MNIIEPEVHVQIEKKHCYNSLPALSAASRETTMAHHHASLFPTRLALTRWTSGGDLPHVFAAEQNMPMRATWYDEAQQRFQTWLDAGGFHRSDDVLDCVLHEAGMTPAGLDGEPACDERAGAPFRTPGIASWPAPEGKR